MKNSFESLVTNLRKSREKCPWSNDMEIEQYVKELQSETKEVVNAIKKKDIENLKEELGDVLMDVLFLGVIAEEKKLFTVKEMISEVNTKLKRRKPWVFGTEIVLTKNHAIQRWNEIKQQEKLQKCKC